MNADTRRYSEAKAERGIYSAAGRTPLALAAGGIVITRTEVRAPMHLRSSAFICGYSEF